MPLPCRQCAPPPSPGCILRPERCGHTGRPLVILSDPLCKELATSGSRHKKTRCTGDCPQADAQSQGLFTRNLCSSHALFFYRTLRKRIRRVQLMAKCGGDQSGSASLLMRGASIISCKQLGSCGLRQTRITDRTACRLCRRRIHFLG